MYPLQILQSFPPHIMNALSCIGFLTQRSLRVAAVEVHHMPMQQCCSNMLNLMLDPLQCVEEQHVTMQEISAL